MARRFTADEVLQEVLTDNDSNDEDFMDELDTSFANVYSDMASNIGSKNEGNVSDSICQDKGGDSEFVAHSSTFNEAGGKASEYELEAIDETEVEIAFLCLLQKCAKEDKVEKDGVEAKDWAEVDNGTMAEGLGRRHGRGRGQGCRQTEVEPEGQDWKDVPKTFLIGILI